MSVLPIPFPHGQSGTFSNSEYRQLGRTQMGGEQAEPVHLRLLRDCAQICITSADFMLRSSEFHLRVCGVCSEVCSQCAESCERIGRDDAQMQECAEICRRCAESCRKMAGIQMAM